jgi:hypothetical protein
MNQQELQRMLNVREEILKTYRVNERGIITSPGQFEGEMYYLPYYWEIYLDGCADRDDGKTLGFDISPEEKIAFPELRRRRTVRLCQLDQGFIVELS